MFLLFVLGDADADAAIVDSQARIPSINLIKNQYESDFNYQVLILMRNFIIDCVLLNSYTIYYNLIYVHNRFSEAAAAAAAETVATSLNKCSGVCVCMRARLNVNKHSNRDDIECTEGWRYNESKRSGGGGDGGGGDDGGGCSRAPQCARYNEQYVQYVNNAIF